MPVTISLRRYWKMMDDHDWYYQMTEDRGVYNRGKQGQAVVESHTGDSMAHFDLYNQFRDYKFHNGPKPVEPEPEV